METSPVKCASLQLSLEPYSQTLWIYFTVRGVNKCLIQFNHTGAAVGTRCICSCWGCRTEKQGEVPREDSGLIGDTSVLWCELKKFNKSSATTLIIIINLFILPKLLIAGLWAFSAGRLFHCSPWHCCTLGAAIRVWYSPKCLNPHPSLQLWFYDRCLYSAILGLLSCPVVLGAKLVANHC